jgi:perosamine synthetase
MMTTQLAPEEQQFARDFEAFFGNGLCVPTAKGRVALFAGLKALELPANSVVAMPAYTCVVVASAVMFAGHRPFYVDIDPATYNIDYNSLEKALPADTRAVIAQHTYGIPADISRIADLCKRKQIHLIEDCCHSFVSTQNGKLCGTFGDFAFFSGQWNKFFTSGLGGFFHTRDEQLARRAAEILLSADAPTPAKDLQMRLQIFLHNHLVRPQTKAMMTALYRLLTHSGIISGSSNQEELLGHLPADYVSRLTPAQLCKGSAELKKVDANISHRQALTDYYISELSGQGFRFPALPANSNAVYLRLPLRVKNRPALLGKAMWRGIELGDWFETPLHANGAPLAEFGYTEGSCPHAEQACAEVVNLPVHPGISQREARRIVAFMIQYAKPLDSASALHVECCA